MLVVLYECENPSALQANRGLDHWTPSEYAEAIKANRGYEPSDSSGRSAAMPTPPSKLNVADLR